MVGLARGGWVSITVALLLGCGSRERAPTLPEETAIASGGSSSGGTGGRSAGGIGGRAEGGAPATGGSGGSAESDAGRALGSPLTGLPRSSEVYILGTLDEGVCGKEALAPLSDPNTYAVGFDCDLFPDFEVIRNGKLLYLMPGARVIREFVPDPWAPSALFYPPDPAANDPALDTPCPGVLGPSKFFVSPAGRLIYECLPDGWFDEGGSAVYPGTENIIALGDDDLVATARGVMNLKDGVVHEQLALQAVYAVRATGGGFHFAVSGPEFDRPELWSVDSVGNTTKLGVYPAPPTGIVMNGTMTFLTSDDALILEGSDPRGSFLDVLVRRTLGGESEVVYNEADHPIVKLHISSLVSGP